MILGRDKKGELVLLANYNINYSFKMEGIKMIEMIEVPNAIRTCRKKRVKDIIEFYRAKNTELHKKIERNNTLIESLKKIQVKHR